MTPIKDALEWALAEIEGRTNYQHKGQRAACIDRLKEALATLTTPAPGRDVPTQAQINSACLSFRHDFGLLDEAGRKQVQFEALEWLRAWQKEGFGADRDEIIERCAAVVDQCNREGPYEAIASAKRIRALKSAILSELPVAPTNQQPVALGDIVVVNEQFQWYGDWRGSRLKVIGLRIEPNGALWADVIEGEQRHRGNGYYDGETTDFDATHLTVVERAALPVAPVVDEAGIRADERSSIIADLQVSYPDHAWLNAVCAAIRSRGTAIRAGGGER